MSPVTARVHARRTWYLQTNAVVAAWLAVLGVVVLTHQGIPVADWLMVHLLLLGAVSTAIIIWSQHFADTLVRRPALGGRRSLIIRLVGHTLGAVLVMIGMIVNLFVVVLVGGVLVGAVAVLHAVLLGGELRRAKPTRFGSLVRYYVVATVSLFGGVGLGIWMANPATGADLHARLYLAHIALNVLGWVGLTAVGTLLLLWPTVLRTRLGDGTDAAARTALPLLTAGVAVVAGASLAGVSLGVGAGALLYLLGLVPVVREAARQARHTPPTTFAGWSLASSMAWLAFSVAALGVLVATSDTATDAVARLGWLLIPLLAGFSAQLLLGALSYLVPMVSGGGPQAGKAAAVELNRAPLFRLLVVNGGIVLYLLPVPSLVKVVLSLLVFGVMLSFLVLLVRAVVAGGRIRSRAGSAPLTGLGVAPVGATIPRRTRSGMAAAAVGALVLAVTAGVALDPVTAGVGAASVTAQGAVTAVSGDVTEAKVTMLDMRFAPSSLTVPAGNRLELTVTNGDTAVHDLTLANGFTSGRVAPGEAVIVDVGIMSDSSEGWCSIAGHRQMGMVLQIVVTGSAATDAAADHVGSGATGSAASAADDLGARTEPSPGFEARDAALLPASAETHHDYTFRVGDTEVEVAPGVTQTLWPFNGTAPGPTLRGKVGDTFTITLINEATTGHSLDFHAGALAPDGPMRTIEPGETLEYSFTATRSGVWLYHCSTMPMSLHIANGMFGAVVIDPAGLDPVDREYLLVQSEFYLGPQGGIADSDKIAAATPDLVVFNGYANQYREQPLRAKVGERIRFWVLDAGPNLASSFHIVGGQFDTVYAEGDYLLRDGGSTGTGGSQTLGLAPAQGGFVELSFPEAGTYPFVTHAMTDAQRGAAGQIVVVP
ncbi:copper oxidase [Cryobacterium suzukii]|uniref:Copper-containing nitrite reductase n=1 Tax=Cryobacterium suzukii TaxID=1259198 RepID=A0A4R9AKD1_9MICO|nr:multicopper oxidase domain-containing protein [Cryobacterium suzukii]TFD62906.1 copper oxidase [Cryobacterium suzukii]